MTVRPHRILVLLALVASLICDGELTHPSLYNQVEVSVTADGAPVPGARVELYTGARPSEIVAAKRTDIQGNALVLQDHKTESETLEPRVIQLPPQALALIESLPAREDGLLIGTKGPFRLWRKIIKDTGIKNFRMYDLRHTFASLLVSGGMTLPMVGRLLGHTQAQTTLRYAHLYDDPLREGLDQVGEVLRPKLRLVPDAESDAA